MGLASAIGRQMAPRVNQLAPDRTAQFVHNALQRAISGVGRMPGAAASADKRLRESGGDVDQAIHDSIETHVRMAGLQGFLTNIGGLVTAAVAIPTNIAGLALVQCRLVAEIAHLRGYDLDDPRVRNAILGCLLGEDTVKALVRKGRLPARPLAIATAPAHDPQLDTIMASEVTSELLTKVAGKRVVGTVGRRIPVMGGVFGAGADGFATWHIGRYADRELRPRKR